MPLTPDELARRRVVNQAAHRTARQSAARTPAERATVAWDLWRRLLTDLPDEHADRYRDAITKTLNAHMDQITQTPKDGR